jgi:hypothetical protein
MQWTGSDAAVRAGQITESRSMRCEELGEIIEAVAAGDTSPDDDVSAHVSGCPACAADLALARRIDRLLAIREVPLAPHAFRAAVLRRLRRDRWRTEQYLDVGFNVVILLSLATMAGGVWLLLEMTGLSSVTAGTLGLFSATFKDVVERARPDATAIAGAIGLLLTAVAGWWWAERGWST